MTAEEAREKTKLVLEAKIDFEKIFCFIDYNIENAVNNGQRKCYVNIDGCECEEYWEHVYHKRDKIIKHYTELGYIVDSHGYDGCIRSDCFTIRW